MNRKEMKTIKITEKKRCRNEVQIIRMDYNLYSQIK